MKLLVVEDDRQSAQHLRTGLTEAGFVVDVCGNGLDGSECARTGHYSVIILDVMLPERDGWSVLEDVRRSGVQSQVLMLTAREAVEDRVKGLDLGADDYLTKPFAFSELVARIRTLLRRRSRDTSLLTEYEGLTIDAPRHEASRYGRPIALTAKEFVLLDLFLRHQGEVLSRTFICERVWDMSFDSDSNVVEVNIGRLRSKIDGPFERKILHTVRRRGYVLR